MLVPCSTNSLPAKLSVRVISARGLPVMDKSNVTTDAFVEVHFENEVYKTDVCSKSLSPVWNSDVFVFETDEQQLFDNPIQFRVMDHDTYSANDAIGRVFYDANLLVSKIRCSKADGNSMEFTNWLPIYDSVYGIRGEIQISISLKLLLSNDHGYVRILSASIISTLSMNDIIGLVSDVATVTDPEYEWIDRIRSPRASNEARQSIIRKSLRELARNIAQKAHSLGSNAILGYHEFVDIEGDATELITFRAFGTAVRLSQTDEKVAAESILHHVLSLKVLPDIYRYKCGVVVCARSAHVLTDDSDAAMIRKKWWDDLKIELIRQTLSLRCNLIIGYTEQISIRKKMALLSCTGTAISVILAGTKHVPDCIRFHTACFDGDASTNQNVNVCSCCKLPDAVCPDIILNSCSLPASDYLHGTVRPLQVHLKREVNFSESDDQLASTISHSLPFLEHELYSKLMEEMRSGNTKYNAVFDLKPVIVIQEGALFAVITGTLCTLKALLKTDDPHILSCSDSVPQSDDVRPTPRVGLLDAARILRTPRSSDKAGLRLHPLHIREHTDNFINGPPQSNYKKIVKCFRKKVIDRERLAKMISEREISLQLGAFDDIKSATWSPSTYSGIRISNSSKFNIIAKSSKSSNIPQRYTGVLIREVTRTMEDIAELDAFLDGALRDLVSLATSNVETVGASSFSVFKVPSVSLSISRDQASLLLFITTDFDCPFNL
ncbi:C2 domain-containing protein [Loa loa]|uniref:C2 domain-containing protein n=1 Tax=Loa loa TaxID=7209 RepID=A0A1I7VI74_LOALO|nr:C2 domain-containing protein [Loa loa]EFO22093.1 C2 domain-containing protein [Loa loa]